MFHFPMVKSRWEIPNVSSTCSTPLGFACNPLSITSRCPSILEPQKPHNVLGDLGGLCTYHLGVVGVGSPIESQGLEGLRV